MLKKFRFNVNVLLILFNGDQSEDAIYNFFVSRPNTQSVFLYNKSTNRSNITN